MTSHDMAEHTKRRKNSRSAGGSQPKKRPNGEHWRILKTISYLTNLKLGVVTVDFVDLEIFKSGH